MRDVSATADVATFGRRIVLGCLANIGVVDAAIEDASEHWALADLGKVERAVLRLGTYELLNERVTPVAVVIDESVELAKTYAGEEASQFVNGVLGHIARERA